MFETTSRPRLIRFDDLFVLVRELRRLGVTGELIYQRVTEIGPVDLDLLKDVLAYERAAA